MQYKQRMAILAKNKERVLKQDFSLKNASGIYIFARVDSNGLKFAYIGQANGRLLDRCVEHLSAYDHLGLSIKKRGFGCEFGWFCAAVEYCNESELNDKEQYWIKEYANRGFQLFNATTGSQGVGKEVIKQKLRKNYSDGLKEGYNKAISLIQKLERQRHETKKDGSPTKIALQAQEEFNRIIKGEETK